MLQRRIAIVAVVVVVAATFSLLTRPPLKDPSLSHELIGMRRAIEDLEINFVGGGSFVVSELPRDIQDRISESRTVDEKNTTRLREILTSLGWPTNKQVGREAVRSALMVVQRSDDLGFQQLAIEKMRVVGADDTTEFAYLVDQVAVRLGVPQTYGTQWTCENGEYKPLTPVKDPNALARLRDEVGLPPYEKFNSSFCAEVMQDEGPMTSTDEYEVGPSQPMPVRRGP